MPNMQMTPMVMPHNMASLNTALTPEQSAMINDPMAMAYLPLSHFGAGMINGAINDARGFSGNIGDGNYLKAAGFTGLLALDFAPMREGKELFKFTGTAAKHMDEAGRMIPIQTLDDIIKAPMSVVKDPQGTKALMHYSQM